MGRNKRVKPNYAPLHREVFMDCGECMDDSLDLIACVFEEKEVVPVVKNIVSGAVYA